MVRPTPPPALGWFIPRPAERGRTAPLRGAEGGGGAHHRAGRGGSPPPVRPLSIKARRRANQRLPQGRARDVRDHLHREPRPLSDVTWAPHLLQSLRGGGGGASAAEVRPPPQHRDPHRDPPTVTPPPGHPRDSYRDPPGTGRGGAAAAEEAGGGGGG